MIRATSSPQIGQEGSPRLFITLVNSKQKHLSVLEHKDTEDYTANVRIPMELLRCLHLLKADDTQRTFADLVERGSHEIHRRRHHE